MSVAGTRAAAGPGLPPGRLPRLIAADGPLGLAEHLARYGPVPFRDAGTPIPGHPIPGHPAPGRPIPGQPAPGPWAAASGPAMTG